MPPSRDSIITMIDVPALVVDNADVDVKQVDHQLAHATTGRVGPVALDHSVMACSVRAA
jgi:hypothetical protein